MRSISFQQLIFSIFSSPLFTLAKKYSTGNLTQLVTEELDQVGKLKMACNFAPVLKVIKKIFKKYYPCLYLSINLFWWVNELWFKRYFQKQFFTNSFLVVFLKSIVGYCYREFISQCALGYQPLLQQHPLFLFKTPLKSANCPSPPFLGNPLCIGFS